MLYLEDIKISFKRQGYEAIQYDMSPQKDQAVLMIKSTQQSQNKVCPRCGGKANIYDNFGIHLRDMPLCINVPLTVFCTGNRYRCTVCRESFTEEIPFKYPGTRITYRAANWIKGFLQQKVSIKSIQELTGITDDTYKDAKQAIKETAKAEKQAYSKLKKLRWTLLTNGSNLSEGKSEYLQSIPQLSVKNRFI